MLSIDETCMHAPYPMAPSTHVKLLEIEYIKLIVNLERREYILAVGVFVGSYYHQFFNKIFIINCYVDKKKSTGPPLCLHIISMFLFFIGFYFHSVIGVTS